MKKCLKIVSYFVVLVVGITLGYGICKSEENVTDKNNPVQSNDYSYDVDHDSNEVETDDNYSTSTEPVIKDDSITVGKSDDAPRVLPEDLEISYSLDEPNSIGTVYGHMTVKNNSDFIISDISIRANITNKDGEKEPVHYTCYDSIIPGSVSTDMETFGSEDMEKININYTILDKETMLKCDIQYEYSTDLISWSKWYK